MSVMPKEALEIHRDAYTSRNVCVTGGAGFIGSHLSEALVTLGASVTIIDDLSNGRLENIAGFADRVRFIEGSILEELERESPGRDRDERVELKKALTASPTVLNTEHSLPDWEGG